MTSKFKALTDNTLQSSLGVSTGAKGQQSRQSASLDNTLPSMQTLSKQSGTMLSTVKSVSEKSRQHAALMKVVLSRLETAGLIRRFRLLSTDQKTVEAVIIRFDNTFWTPELELRVLSGETTEK